MPGTSTSIPGVTGVLVATPTYRDAVNVYYMASLLDALRELDRRAIPNMVSWSGNSGLVAQARNQLAAGFLAWGASHMVFVDSDIEFTTADFLRLIAHPVDVVAAFYTNRTHTPERHLIGVPLQDDAGRSAVDRASGLVVGLMAGTAFMSITRSALLAMIAAYPESKILRQQTGLAEMTEAARHWHYNLFPTGLVDGCLETEDFAFCRLYRAIGGRVWLDPQIALKHHGQHAYELPPAPA